MTDVTMVTPLRNGLYSTALMRESFLKHHDKIPWIVCDDASWDGVTDYVKTNADELIVNPKQIHFGQSLDYVCKAAKTPYILTTDNDIEFLAPILSEMLSVIADALCVATTFQGGINHFHDFPLVSQRKIDHACALWNAEKLHHILNYFSFEAYMNCMKLEYYDGGLMVYRAAAALNYKIIEFPKIWENVIHFGGVAVHFCDCVSDDPVLNKQIKAHHAQRYDTIKNRLFSLREGEQSYEGLTWINANENKTEVKCSRWEL